MQPVLLRLVFAMVLSLLAGCSGTTTELPDKLDSLRVTIEAEHRTEVAGNRKHEHHCIRALLANAEGAAIERADVKIEVNGTPMRYRVSQGNYYDRHPYHRLDGDDRFELAPGAQYDFVLVLPDGTRHSIGKLRAPAALMPEQFDLPKGPPASGPVTIAWRKLAEPAQLRIGRTEERRSADGSTITDGTGPYDPDAFQRTIGPGGFRRHTDRLVIPDELLVSTPERKLLWLQAEITVNGEGRVSSSLSKKSTMRVVRRIQLEMRFASID